jgi:hypothetical protein
MALSLVEDPSLADPLFRLYDRMAERQLRQRGRLGSPYIESPET